MSVLALVLAALSVACSSATSISSTPSAEDLPEQRELSTAVVWMAVEPDRDDTELSVFVTYAGCSGGTLPEEIDSIEVEETGHDVTIEAFIRLPPGPFPTTCPENPVLEEVVGLDSPLADRHIYTRRHDATGTLRRFALWPP